MEEKTLRISKSVAMAMIAVAIGFDLLELLVDWIPFLGQVISLLIDTVAGFTIWLWMKVKDVDLASGKYIARFWLPVLVEMLPIPVIDTGLLTVGVILTIMATQVEDKTGIKIPQKPTVKRPRNISKV